MAAASLRLYSDWTPTDGEGGTLALALNNLSDRTLGNFRLAFTSHVQLQPHDELAGASLLEQLSGYHVIAPASRSWSRSWMYDVNASRKFASGRSDRLFKVSARVPASPSVGVQSLYRRKDAAANRWPDRYECLALN